MHSKKDSVFEFPEDKALVLTNVDDYNAELLTNKSSITQNSRDNDPPNRTFLASLLILSSAAVSILFATFLSRFSPLVGSFLSFVFLLIFREWNRVYGDKLTQRIKVTINYASILKENKSFIPQYKLNWLFGNEYKPYSYGCTGPTLNPDMERTPDDPESRSPQQVRTDEKLRKDL